MIIGGAGGGGTSGTEALEKEVPLFVWVKEGDACPHWMRHAQLLHAGQSRCVACNTAACVDARRLAYTCSRVNSTNTATMDASSVDRPPPRSL